MPGKGYPSPQHRLSSVMLCLFCLLPLLTLLAGCSTEGRGVPEKPDAYAPGRGAIILTIDWPRSRSRLVPASADHIRIDVLDGKGEYLTAAIARPATGAVVSMKFSNINTGDLRISAIAFNAPEPGGYPVAWGTMAATVPSTETLTTDILLDNPIAWDGNLAGLPQPPHILTGQLNTLNGGNAQHIAGAWSWDAKLKNAAGAEFADPADADWTIGHAFTIVAAGGQFYTLYFSGTEPSVQVPVIPEWTTTWDLINAQAMTRQQLITEIPPFMSQYVTVFPGAALSVVSLGSINLSAGSPGGGASVVVQ